MEVVLPARVLVLGIDCLTPKLVFDMWRRELPCISALIDEGIWGPLRSTDPPITVPAWASMLTGRDPGELGIYGFRKRHSHEPTASPSLVTGDDVRFPWVWDVAGAAGLESLVIGVPPTWPPRRIRGRLVTDFLTPDTTVPFTWPGELADEVEDAAGGPYLLDAVGRAGQDPASLVERVREMTERRFKLLTSWLESSEPALAVMMEIGLDRLQHALWHHMDPEHVRYAGAGGPLEDALLDYHGLLDECIARALEAAGTDAHVLLVSDHGAQAMEGGVRINEWLRREGWLVVESGPNGEAPDRLPWGTPLSRCRVDWRRSRAFAEGGYCGRVHLNVEGRSREWAVAAADYESEMDSLSRSIRSIAAPGGEGALNVRLHRPSVIYREVRGVAPDLMVYFDDLRFRALGTIGSVPSSAFEEALPAPASQGRGAAREALLSMSRDPSSVLFAGNDIGPDGANHAMEGVFVLREAGGHRRGERRSNIRIYDVFSTVLRLLGLEAPDGVRGSSVTDVGAPRRS